MTRFAFLSVLLAASVALAQTKSGDPPKVTPKQDVPKVDAPKADPSRTEPQPAVVTTATTPVPRAGEWRERHTQMVAKVKEGGHEVAFLGDSITEGWGGEGKAAWEKTWAPMKGVNLGIGGDRTQHVLWRLQNGLGEALADGKNNVKLVVLMIGTNNSNGTDNTAEEIGGGITKIVGALREKLPKAKVLILGIFPRGEKANPQREKNAAANAIAAKLADGKQVRYLDLGERFLEKDGTLTKEVMPDFLHLSRRGYQAWTDAMKPVVEDMLK